MIKVRSKQKTRKTVKRGNVYFADLSPIVGSEQGGTRPCVIIQNNIGNRYSPTVIIAAITCKLQKTSLPTHIQLSDSHYNSLKESTVLLEQLRTIDRSRLQSFVGCLDRNTMQLIDDALSLSVGLKI